MKKIYALVAVTLLPFASLTAGPRGCGPCPGGWCRPCPPPPPHHHHWGCCGNSGVRLAADIVGLVGVSIGTARMLAAPQPQPVVVQQPVVVTQPVVVQQPVVVTQPAAVQQQTAPRPKTVTILPDGTRIEKY